MQRSGDHRSLHRPRRHVSRTTHPIRWSRRTWSTPSAPCVDHGADLALVFDGDADRCFIIDERGEVVSPSAVTAMIASQELRARAGRDHRDQQDHLLGGAGDRRGGRRTDRDHQGRAHLRQGGDGRARRDLRRRAFGALLLPRLLGRRHRHAGGDARAGRWSALATSRCPSWPPGSPATRPRARSTPSSTTSSRSWTRSPRRSPTAASQDRLDGLTVAGDDWWVNVRPSNTEPLLRLNVEAATQRADGRAAR